MTKQKHVLMHELLGTKRIFSYLVVKNKYYEMSPKDGQTAFVEVPKKKVTEQLKMAEQLTTKLKDSLDSKKILMEIFMTRYNKKELEALYKTTFKSKKKYKPKTRDDHCVDMKVGNHIIPIID